MKKVIEIQNIKRNFQVGDETVHALRGVSFNINEGEFVTIMGTSGSGKSTLLNILGCLDTPTSGEYLLDDIPVRTMSKPQRAVLRNRKIGFVFQSYNLLPKTTAVENVELPLMYNSAVSASERRRRAIESLQAVGLGDRLVVKVHSDDIFLLSFLPDFIHYEILFCPDRPALRYRNIHKGEEIQWYTHYIDINPRVIISLLRH